MTWIAGVDGCHSGWIVVLVSSEKDTEHRSVLCKSVDEVLCLEPHPRVIANNQARIQPFTLAYNLGNFLHRLALPRSVKHWSLTTLREKLIKIGAKVVRHAKYLTFQMAEVAVPRELLAAIIERIQRFGAPPPLLRRG